MKPHLPLLLTLILGLLVAAPVQAADPVSDGQWFHRFLNTEQAHTITKGADITVAVIDSGVDATQPDLTGSVLSGHDLTATTGGNGHTDIDGHGTAMAGLIAAHGRVTGIAPEAEILPVRTSVRIEGAVDKLAVGIRWAVANGAKVISISRGADTSGDLLLEQEVQKALAADIVVVAAAGNRPQDDQVLHPAAIPGVVAVAGVDQNGNHSAVSVSGPEVVIAAPSDDISSTGPNGVYPITTGTSDATAIVAGAVALVRAKFPELKGPDVVRRLTETATDKGTPGRDPDYGYGVLNLVGALTADVPVDTTATPKTSASTNPPSTSNGFPWWLVAVAVLPILAVVILLFLRRARRVS